MKLSASSHEEAAHDVSSDVERRQEGKKAGVVLLSLQSFSRSTMNIVGLS